MKRITIILLFLMTLSSPVAAQDYIKGYDAYEAGDYVTALREWRPNPALLAAVVAASRAA